MFVCIMRHLPCFVAGAVAGIAVSAGLYASAGPPSSLDLPPVAVTSAEMTEGKRHLKWMADTMQRIEEIKPGRTRADLLKIFIGDGGISTRTRRLYVYRACTLIKVEVEFTPAEGLNKDAYTEDGKDVIKTVSKPFLQSMYFD